VRVVESGSFSAVARELGTRQPALEEHLGAQLMRASCSLSLTEAGRDFYGSAVRLISDLKAAGGSGTARGTSVTATVRRMLGASREAPTGSKVRRGLCG